MTEEKYGNSYGEQFRKYENRIAELEQKIGDLEWQLKEIAKDNENYQKENAKLEEKVRIKDFFYEANGFTKRGLNNSIQIAEYIDKLETEIYETKKKIMEVFSKDDMQQQELWRACGLRLVGWDYEKNKLDDNFMILYGVSN